MTAPPTVFVIDDDPSIRRAMERVMKAAGLEVSAFASAQEFLEQYDPRAPGCLLLDLRMPQSSGLDLQRELASRGDARPVIFLSGRADVPASVQAMKRGAVEFLTKPADEGVLLEAVRDAIERDRVGRVLRAELAEIRRRLATLTPRERQVLDCVVAGKLNKQAAEELGAAEKTIKVHRGRVMKKMQVNSLADLVHLAARAGIRP